MKKFFVYALLSLLSMSVFAQNEGRPPMGPDGPKGGQKPPKKEKMKKEKKADVDDIVEGKVPGKVYVYGSSFEFGDSVVYFSEIIEVDSLTVTKKNKFLPYRSDFSQQFKDKLEGPSCGLKNQTTSVFYSDKKEKLEKTLSKMKKKVLVKQKRQVVTITKENFKFVHPLDYVSL